MSTHDPEMAQAQRPAQRMPADGSSRAIGMVLGGGAGSFFLILFSGQVGLPVEWLLSLPGIGVALGAGLFSFRKSRPWGVAAVVVGYAWTVAMLWLTGPTKIDLGGLALRLPLSLAGALHTVLLVVLGLTVGAGWEKSFEPEEEPGDDDGDE